MAKIIVKQLTTYLKPITSKELEIVIETIILKLTYIADNTTPKKKLNKGTLAP